MELRKYISANIFAIGYSLRPIRFFDKTPYTEGSYDSLYLTLN